MLSCYVPPVLPGLCKSGCCHTSLTDPALHLRHDSPAAHHPCKCAEPPPHTAPAVLQAIGSITTLTELVMDGSSGLTFAHLQPLSKLLRLHTLVTGTWRPDKHWVAASEQEGLTDEACMPAAGVLSSWFPALQDMTYWSCEWRNRMRGRTLHCGQSFCCCTPAQQSMCRLCVAGAPKLWSHTCRLPGAWLPGKPPLQ